MPIAETFADPPRVHPYLPFCLLFGLPPLFGPVFAIFPLFPSLFLPGEKSSWAEPGRRRDRSLGAVILFTRRWARLLIEDSTLVIFARFEREEGGVRARLIVLCDFVRGTIVAQLMIERFCNDFGWKSCTLEIIDIVFQFDIFSIYRCWNFFLLSEKKKLQMLLMSLENF